MADAAIPLGYRNPQFADPTAVMGRALSLQEMAQRAQMAPEQLRALQMENQQRDLQMKATQALNESIQDNLQSGPDGIAIDHEGVARSLAQKGFGAQAPGYLANALKVQGQQADLIKKQLENKGTVLEQATQALQGVPVNATPNTPEWDQAEAAYQQAMPAVKRAAVALGADPATIPPHYDPNTVQQYISHGMKAKDFVTQAYHAADLAQRLSLGLPKAAGEANKEIQNDVANAQSDTEYQTILQKWNALAKRDPNGIIAGALKSYPANWSEDVSDQARRGMIPIAEQPTVEQKNLGLNAQKLAGAARQGRQQYLNALNGMRHGDATAFPAPPDEDSYDPEKFATQVMKVGMTPAQASTAFYQGARVQQGAQRINLEQSRINLERDRSKSDKDRQFLFREMDRHDALQKQEKEQWTLHQALGDVLQNPDNDAMVMDPTTKSNATVRLGDVRSRLKAEFDKAAATAKGLGDQQRSMRQRYGWGEYGPQQPAAGAPPAAPAPNAAAAPPAAPTAPKTAKFTEQQVRERAKANNVDPDAAVAAAKKADLLQQ